MILFKGLRQRFGISAPQVAVRPRISWYWRAFSIVLLCAVVLGVAWWAYDAGQKLAGFDRSVVEEDLARLKAERARLAAQNEELRARVARADGQLAIERAVHGDLAKQVKALLGENAKLKEDLAFFQSLMAAGGKGEKLAIHRLKLERDMMPGEYHYSLLLVRTGERLKDFQGRLQFLVNMRQNGKQMLLTLPEKPNADASVFHLNFKFYQRVEGIFRVPPEAVVESLQVRVYQNGSPEAKIVQSVKLF